MPRMLETYTMNPASSFAAPAERRIRAIYNPPTTSQPSRVMGRTKPLRLSAFNFDKVRLRFQREVSIVWSTTNIFDGGVSDSLPAWFRMLRL